MEEKMYSSNSFSRRRSEGWAERRRYFRKLLAKLRPEVEEKAKDKAPVASK
jgi:hypothetical protein